MEAELKEGVLLPELLAALPGTFVDEQREVTVKFPDDYSEPKLAAREGTIRVTVRGIKEKVLPELNDELAKQLSGGKHETLEAYREAIRSDLEEAAKAMSRMAREQALVKALVDSSQVEVSGRIPEVKKSQTARRYFESRLRRLKVLDRLAEVGGVREPAKP